MQIIQYSISGTMFRLTKEVAYDAGVQIGDGNMYLKNRTCRITYSGNLRNEKEFYKKILPKIIKKAYRVSPIYVERPEDNTVLLIVNSKDIVKFKSKVLKLPTGKKEMIQIPKVFFENSNLLKHCIRGIADTDMCLSFQKNRKELYTEPRLEIYIQSKKLANQFKKILKKFKFTFAFEEKQGKYKGFMIRMYGRKNLFKWIKIFGFSNPWTNVKIKVWQKFGYFPIQKNYTNYLQMLKVRSF